MPAPLAFGRPAKTEFVTHEARESRVRYLWASLRLVMGAIFAWAFVDKLFGLGFATTRENAWISGGSPTNGFLSFGTKGPLAEAFQAIAGNPVVDALFMLGLAGIGFALLFGIGMRVAGVSGAVMMLLMWAAALPPENHPFLDDHIVYAIVLLLLPAMRAGHTWGFGARWSRSRLVARAPALE